MSPLGDHDQSGPAFPCQGSIPEYTMGKSGMSLRDYFAAAACQGILAKRRAKQVEVIQMGDFLRELAKCSYQVADAMLKAREEVPT